MKLFLIFLCIHIIFSQNINNVNDSKLISFLSGNFSLIQSLKEANTLDYNNIIEINVKGFISNISPIFNVQFDLWWNNTNMANVSTEVPFIIRRSSFDLIIRTEVLDKEKGIITGRIKFYIRNGKDLVYYISSDEKITSGVDLSKSIQISSFFSFYSFRIMMWEINDVEIFHYSY